MIKKLILITLLLAFASSSALASETIAGFDQDKDLPILNEELRRLRNDSEDNATDISVITSSVIIQIVNTQISDVATGTTRIPLDDTIPQNDEGNEYMTLAITPTSATNKLKIEVCVGNSASTTAGKITVALFQDAVADALATTIKYFYNPNRQYPLGLNHYMTAGTTSEITFKVRIGNNELGTTTFNGLSGTRYDGGVCYSSITITEIKG